MTDRQVKVTLVIDEKGAVHAMRTAGEESARTEGKLSHLDKSVKGLGHSFGGLKSLALGGLGAVGVGGLAFGIADIANKTKEIALETEKFHAVTGISATSSLYYSKALLARGLSGEAVAKAFGILAKNTKSADLQERKYAQSQATATAKGKVNTAVLGRQAAAFQELGINMQQFNNQLSEQGKLEQITKKFEALAPGIRKTRLERELFGRGANMLAIVLEKGNLGLTHQVELVKKFFPTIKGGANAMNELLEKQTESKMAWEGLEFTLGQKLIPVMTKAMSLMSQVAIEVEKGQGTWGELGKTFESIGKFAGNAFGFIKEIASALNVKLGGDTLGAVLAAAGIGHVGKKAAKPVEKLGKFALGHPEIAPLAVGAAIPFASAVGIHAGVEALSPGYLKGHSVGEVNRAILGGQLTPGGGGSQRSRAGGKAVAGAETSAEATLLSKLIEKLQPTNNPVEAHIYVDSVEVAARMLHNPRARRELAEAVAKYGTGMVARG